MLVENILCIICKLLGFEIFKEIMGYIEYKMNLMYFFVYED